MSICHLDLKSEHPRICLAEKQTVSKGRRKRFWFSPFAKNIYLSLLWHFEKDLSELSGLSLVIAIAAAEVLQQKIGSKNMGVKWPNDILWLNQKKLAGILIELSGETQTQSRAIISIGLNVNMDDATPGINEITQSWISLKKINRIIRCHNNKLYA